MNPALVGVALVLSFQTDHLAWPKVYPALIMNMASVCLQIQAFKNETGVPSIEGCGD